MVEPDLNLLIALDALISEANVTRAARRLGLSPSAMSRTLTRLRATTDDPLLVRAGRQMVLTPYAENIRGSTQDTVSAALAILRPSAASLDLSKLERTFTIRTNEGFVEVFGAALIASTATRAPFVRLCFSAKEEKSAKHLREGLVDLEIGVLGEMGPEIRLQALFRDRFVGAVRKGHPLLEPKNSITPAKYAACRHVITSRHGLICGPVDKALAELGLKRNIAAAVPSFPAAMAVAMSSDLVALVPSSLLLNRGSNNENETATTIRSFELPVKTQEITISQMWHPRLDADPIHRWLRQHVLEVCQQQMQRINKTL
ncbi:LysR family transcriptional regulator [Advenella mimigardefordensis]|uniref:Transcriptional regulator, LysR family n=1 Tax=Advenella mimigardefordensis (strain DSM 17166 / LMG 22922 / DPN7) TaxID=1247726 RepID=W0PH10_ADVMD|nr:LysR family transcriptional regulator [Advenella mimigardefordensis]AHG65766.1 transcriptional regulator, LysR family [Advenella mimigardefordensis DPN7]